MNQLIEPEDIDKTILFLASEQAWSAYGFGTIDNDGNISCEYELG